MNWKLSTECLSPPLRLQWVIIGILCLDFAYFCFEQKAILYKYKKKAEEDYKREIRLLKRSIGQRNALLLILKTEGDPTLARSVGDL